MAGSPVNPPALGASLTIPIHLWARLRAHLFPGDHAGHGAALLAGWAPGPRGLRLLARDFIPARDGIDYIPGEIGHHALSATFVRDVALRARNEHAAYIPVHNHGGTTAVRFSSTDLASHQRGYPAIQQITGTPVCALVLTEQAAAGDLWLPDGSRSSLAEVVIPGNNLIRLRPSPEQLSGSPIGAGGPAHIYDRQVRIFGDVGQRTFQQMSVAIVGLGGIGILLTEYLARLGVGHLVLVDDDTVDETNLPRLAGARHTDVDQPKTDLAQRLACQAHPEVRLTPLRERAECPRSRHELTQCDWVFLAADGAAARHWVNAVVQQHLIPATQVGVKIPVRCGVVGQIHAVTRPLLPGTNCLWCDGLIDPTELAIDMQSPRDRDAARYVPGVPAASVLSLNALAAAEAASHFMHAVTGLHHDDTDAFSVLHRTRSRDRDPITSRQDPGCRWCQPTGQLGSGGGHSF
ncbi:ThiF family adenylyltransferase [Streptomyces sp. NPDC093248]|uniref:ThiF family adenylyltransferase n=1 Tax=Streptomyces sp. NPDC093248 TaxID=3155072 RepID=UPI00341FD87A